MRLQSIELIRRENGFFHFRGQKIKAVRQGAGVGVALLFRPSVVDKDFSEVLEPETYLWFPSARYLKEIMDAFDRSDDLTGKMIHKDWEGERPRTMKVADFL